MMPTVFDTIRTLGLERKAEQRRKSTLARTLNNGRCGVCRKKPYDCRCATPTLKPAPEPVKYLASTPD